MSPDLLIRLLIILLIVLLVSGVVLMALGLRGAGFTGDPLCANCRYNLTGLVRETQPRCPECGADLFAPEAVQFGRWTYKPKMITIGSGLIIVATYALAFLYLAV